MTGEAVNLLGLTAPRMHEFFADLGEPAYRARQVLKWIHHAGIADFEQMTDLGKSLRQRLSQIAEVRAPQIASEQVSADGTRKWAIRVDGGGQIETVLIPDGQRATLCVSSQVGCSLDCGFCATGKQGFQKNLSVAEIIGQLWLVLQASGGFQAGQQRRVTNVVMMGMGEPLLNFDNVVDAMELMLDDLGYGISRRRVTLSTAGVVPALERLVGRSQVSLAISLHAANNALRDQLVPINRKYPIEMLLASARNYIESQTDRNRVVTIEYTLLAGINDQPWQARELARLLRDFPCKINLIPCNPVPGSDYRRPSGNAVSRFWKELVEAGCRAMVRTTRGDDIDAACGQLVGQVVDRTTRSRRYPAAGNLQNSQNLQDLQNLQVKALG